MEFDTSTLDYIRGKNFSGGYVVNFDFPKKAVGYRDEILSNYVKDKKGIKIE